MKILGTGLSGLVGSRIVELLSDRFEFEQPVFDITQKIEVNSIIHNSNSEILLHLAAKTNVDECELDKPYGIHGEAWKINVLGTQHITEAANATNKKVIFISTDFVFDGTQNTYTEDDTPHPINWYALTKYEGEKIVLASSKNTVIRIGYPYKARNSNK